MRDKRRKDADPNLFVASQMGWLIYSPVRLAGAGRLELCGAQQKNMQDNV